MLQQLRILERPVSRKTPVAQSGEPANDNLSLKALAQYAVNHRVYAGADYVPAGAKAWWLP